MERHADYIPFVSSGPYPLRAGNFVRPLVDGEPAFRRICQAVEAARKSVWVTVAFIERGMQMPDGRGSFFDVLDRAKARGIDVRALFWRCPELEAVDPGTHFSGTEEECGFLAERGSRFLARWDRAQKLYCHHQKSWLVDAGELSEVAFVGGINLQQSSVAAPGHAHSGGEQVHDVYLELRGPAATDVHHNFVQRWNEATERTLAHGLWPDAAQQNDLAFPSRVSAAVGEIPVQIQRTVRRGMYRDSTPTPGGERFEIEQGDYSILDQYQRAIDSARRSIYLEDQAIGSAQIVDALHAALRRGVEVVFLMPGKANEGMVAGLRNPESEPFRNAVAGLGAYPSFALVAIAASTADGACHDIYVHSKIALIDDAWCTIGSTNIANRSFHGDTELNASFWHAQTVRTLRRELLLEHTGVDTADLDDQAALRLYATRARENTARRARGEPLQGLAFALDPATYAR
jgi:phosphatidylserine/phosphatidylglycerophosphate/cardiolipin synthase-like enzyme